MEDRANSGGGGGRVAWSAACDGKEESEAIRLNWFTVEQRKQIYLCILNELHTQHTL